MYESKAKTVHGTKTTVTYGYGTAYSVLCYNVLATNFYLQILSN